MLLLSDSGNYAPGVMDNRTRQWLGATVRSSGEDGKILVSRSSHLVALVLVVLLPVNLVAKG